MAAMGRQKTKNKDLPPRLFARKGKKRITYYYTPSIGDRKPINLGHELSAALMKWAELEAGRDLSGNATFAYIAKQYERDVIVLKSPATQKDNAREIKNLLAVFGKADINVIEPHHVRKYLTARGKTAKVRANREKALLSHIYNYAREQGYTKNANPCAGIRGFEESGRDRYVRDTEYNAVWNVAHPTVQDVMDLMLYTGQRPADVLKMTRQDIWDNALWVTQNKTGTKRGIALEGEFKAIIERCKNRQRKAESVYLVADENGQPLKFWTLTDRFKRARATAGVNFQLRDIRPKNATDEDDFEVAHKRLGHSTRAMTEKYIRNRKGQRVQPGKGVKRDE